MTFEECVARLQERFPPGRTKLLVRERCLRCDSRGLIRCFCRSAPTGGATLEQMDEFLRSISAPFEVDRLEGSVVVLRERDSSAFVRDSVYANEETASKQPTMEEVLETARAVNYMLERRAAYRLWKLLNAPLDFKTTAPEPTTEQIDKMVEVVRLATERVGKEEK